MLCRSITDNTMHPKNHAHITTINALVLDHWLVLVSYWTSYWQEFLYSTCKVVQGLQFSTDHFKGLRSTYYIVCNCSFWDWELKKYLSISIFEYFFKIKKKKLKDRMSRSKKIKIENCEGNESNCISWSWSHLKDGFETLLQSLILSRRSFNNYSFSDNETFYTFFLYNFFNLIFMFWNKNENDGRET